MLSIDILKAYGANVDEGLVRCMGQEDFYLKLVNMALEDKAFDRLKEALAAGNLDTAFEAAHSLKGVMSNLALVPLFRVTSEITEHLRAREDLDYGPLLQAVLKERDNLILLRG